MSCELADGSSSGATTPCWSGSGLTTFVGRDQALAHLSDLVFDPAVRLVTLTGPGGVGKSRLAVVGASRLAIDFTDGVLIVELAPVVDASLFASAVWNARIPSS